MGRKAISLNLITVPSANKCKTYRNHSKLLSVRKRLQRARPAPWTSTSRKVTQRRSISHNSSNTSIRESNRNHSRISARAACIRHLHHLTAVFTTVAIVFYWISWYLRHTRAFGPPTEKCWYIYVHCNLPICKCTVLTWGTLIPRIFIEKKLQAFTVCTRQILDVHWFSKSQDCQNPSWIMKM